MINPRRRIVWTIVMFFYGIGAVWCGMKAMNVGSEWLFMLFGFLVVLRLSLEILGADFESEAYYIVKVSGRFYFGLYLAYMVQIAMSFMQN